MDEPLSNLDAKLRVQTRAQDRRAAQRLGVTTVYVTHDQVEGKDDGRPRSRCCSTASCSRSTARGRSPYDRPRTRSSPASSAPAMNIRTVRLTENGPTAPARAVYPCEQVAAAPRRWRRRPGHRRLPARAHRERRRQRGRHPGRRRATEELGSDAYVHGHAQLNGGHSKETLVVRTDGRVIPRMGETVFLRRGAVRSTSSTPAPARLDFRYTTGAGGLGAARTCYPQRSP